MRDMRDDVMCACVYSSRALYCGWCDVFVRGAIGVLRTG